MTDPATTTLLGTGLGYALSIALFVLDQLRGKKATHEIISALEDDRTIRDYIEWLGRQNHEELLQRMAASEDALLTELGSLGTELHGMSSRLLGEIASSHEDLIGQLRDLNGKFTMPVLSPVPLRTRPMTAVPMLARDEELAWLQNLETDGIVFGQPGSGKTFLLYQYAISVSGRFLITRDPDTAANAVLSGCPPLIVIDDASGQADLIRRLVHLRGEHSLAFRIVAVCWPFERDDLLNSMGLPPSAACEVQLLGRDVVAELVQKVVADAGFEAPSEIVREIVNQAVGRPGLAVALTMASLQEDLQAVMRGEKLAEVMGRYFRVIVGPAATNIIAGFSVGGKAGMEMDAVAAALQIPIFDLHEALRNMAPGGVLESASRTKFVAIPKALRRALLKQAFFNTEGVCLPTAVYEQLLQAAPDFDQAILSLLQSAHSGAVVDATRLQGLVAQARGAKVWDAYAWLGANECRYVIDHRSEMIEHIVDAALHYVPKLMIPRLLDQAVTDSRPLNSHTQAPLRKLGDWVSHARVGTTEAIGRRRQLFECTRTWLEAGGDRDTAFRALEYSFKLSYESTDTDPGGGMKVTFSSGLLTPPEIAQLAELWASYQEIIRAYGVQDWKPVTAVISEWLHPRNRFGKAPVDEYDELTVPIARQMIEELLPLCNGHNGFLRWALMHAEEAGIDTASVPVAAEYMQVFPAERLAKAWNAKEEKNAHNASALVDSWRDLSISDTTARLKRYDAEASSMDNSWPRLSPYVCRLLAEQRDVSEAEILGMLDIDLATDLVAPFLRAALEKGIRVDQALTVCAGKSGYQHLAVYHTLMGKTPHLYGEIQGLLPAHAEHIEHLSCSGQIPEDIMHALLTHENVRVRLAAALTEFRCDPEREVRDVVHAKWRTAIVEGMADLDRSRNIRHIHDIDKIIAYERTLAFDIIIAMAKRDELALSMWDLSPIMPLLNALNTEEKLQLLDACEQLFVSEIPGVLIGDDLDMYAQFLQRPEMRRHHLKPLIGSPSGACWADKALVALEAGYTPMDVALAARGNHWTSWGPRSKMWQKWVDEFTPLLEHENSRIQAVGHAGVEWSTAERDRSLQRERNEDVYGRFGE